MKQFEIKLFKSLDGKTEIEVNLEKETLWLNQIQLESLFQTHRTSINRHISNIYKSGELKEYETCTKTSEIRIEGNRRVSRSVKYYNLDVIIAVGYRVNSKRGTEFRIWANKVLRNYLIRGYAINQKHLERQNEQLQSLRETVRILGSVLRYKSLNQAESTSLIRIASDYADALDLLDQYDYQTLTIRRTSYKNTYELTYAKAKEIIEKLKTQYGGGSALFAHEKDQSFQSSLQTIYQTFGGEDLYPSLEEKAANLLYFITKNHSFTDGNKRIAAFLFLYFLEKNGILYNDLGEKQVENSTLVALTLMIAVSKSDEKETMIKVIVNLIS